MEAPCFQDPLDIWVCFYWYLVLLDSTCPRQLFDLLKPGLLPLLRSVSHLGSSISLLGKSIVGSFTSALDFLHIGSSMFIRCGSRLGSTMLIFGMSCFDSLPSTMDLTLMASFVFMQDASRFGLALLAFSAACSEPFLVGARFCAFWFFPAIERSGSSRVFISFVWQSCFGIRVACPGIFKLGLVSFIEINLLTR